MNNRNKQPRFSRLVRDLVRYGLRFQILPGPDAERRARGVIAFCRRHRISSVHFFFNGEEWHRGHPTEPEIREYVRMFRRLIPLFRRARLSVCLNPWTTVGHIGRGCSSPASFF